MNTEASRPARVWGIPSGGLWRALTAACATLLAGTAFAGTINHFPSSTITGKVGKPISHEVTITESDPTHTLTAAVDVKPGWVNVSFSGNGTNSVVATITGTPPSATTENVELAVESDDSFGFIILDILSVNNVAPELDAMPYSLADQMQDDTDPPGSTIAAMYASAPGGVTDPDDTEHGVAIIIVNDTNGTWEYRLDGEVTWTPFPAVDIEEALLLGPNDYVRFIPNPGFVATSHPAFIFQAWDQTTGTAGSIADSTSSGGASAFSSAAAWAYVTVKAPNSAPVLNSNADLHFVSIAEDDVTNPGQTVESIMLSDPLTQDAYTDADLADSDPGIAVLALDTSMGTWQYSLNNGANWTDFSGVSEGGALLLSHTDLIRLVPAQDYAGSSASAMTIRAWDQSVFSPGDVENTTNNGGEWPFSVDTVLVRMEVIPVNDAPVLTPQFPNFTPINEDPVVNNGDEVATLIAGAVTDVDAGAARGIAVYAVDDSNGTWQYSDGIVWTDISGVSVSSALLLRDTEFIRFVPNPNFSGSATITYRAWDQSFGFMGDTADTTVNGQDSAFSIDADTATITVMAVEDAPVFTSTPVTTATEEQLYIYNITVTDGDGDDLTIGYDGVLPPWLTFTPVGNGTPSAFATLSGTPDDADLAGSPYSITLTVTDGKVIPPSQQNFTITITPVNDAPNFTSTPVMTATEEQLYIYNITVADADTNGDELIISYNGILPSWLNFTDNGNGTATLSGTPDDPDLAGSPYSITLTVTDGIIAVTITQSFTITITAVNDAPEFTSPPVTSVDEESLYTYNITVADADANGDELIIGYDGILPSWLNFTDNGNGTATLSGTPDDPDLAGSPYSITLTVTDGVIASPVTQSFTITVNPVNDAPAFTSVPVTTATEEVQYTYIITTDDLDGDNLTIGYSGILPDWLTLTDNGNGTATLSGTPDDPDLAGSPYSITLTVTDGVIATPVMQNFTITITGVNDTPAFTSTPVTNIDENTLYTYNIGVNDPDGDTLIIGYDGTLPDWLSFTDNGDGTATLTGTPDEEDVLNSPFSITLTVTDGVIATPVEQSFNISVDAINDPPVFTSTPVTTVNEESPYNYVITVQDIDTIPAVDDLTISVETTLPDWLDFQATDNGTPTATASITGTPDDADLPTSPVSVKLRVSDGVNVTDQDFTITIVPINDAPELDNSGEMVLDDIAEDDITNNGTLVSTLITSGIPDAITDEDQGALKGIALIGVDTASATWEYSLDDGDNWAAVDAGVADDAALLLRPEDRIRALPSQDFNGLITDAISFRAWDQTDGAAGDIANATLNGLATAFSTAFETANLTVTPVNDPPVAVNDPTDYDAIADGPRIEVNEDTVTQIDVLANDTDVEGLNPATLQIVTPPSFGAAGVIGGKIQYSPPANTTGKTQIRYRITDIGDNGAPPLFAEAIAYIEVVPFNDPPNAQDDSASTDAGVPVVIDVLANDSDEETPLRPEDGTPPNVVVSTPPTEGTAEVDPVTGNIVYTSAPNTQGQVVFYYTVTDFGDPDPPKSATAKVTVLVSQTNLTVSTLDDNDDGALDPGELSFREAVKLIANGGTIDFDPALFGMGQSTIVLNGPEIVASKGFTLAGPGAHDLVISADGKTRVLNLTNGDFAFSGVTFADGHAASGNGGAVRLASGTTLSLTDCVVQDSTVAGSGQGGGIYAAGELTLTRTTIAGNSAGGSGGAVYSNTLLYAENVTISGNSAGTDGGAIQVAAGDATIMHATIVYNSATTGGGVSRQTGNVLLENNIISGNAATGSGDDVSGIFTPSTANIIGTLDGSEGLEDTAITGITADDLVEPVLGANGGPTLTHALLPDSAAIDAADAEITANAAITTDQRLLPRDAAPDYGAYEIRYFTVDIATDEDDGNLDEGDLSLREAIGEVLPGDIILFAENLGEITIDPALAYIQVERTVGVFGDPDAGQVLSGGGATSILYVPGTSTHLVLRNLTLTDALDTVSLENRGGPALRSFGTVRAYDCEFTNNQAQGLDGGAIRNNGKMTLFDCTLTENAADNLGGAILNWAGNLRLERCLLTDNTAGQNGGAVQNQLGGTLTIVDSEFSGNAASTSGAVHNATNGTLIISGSTFAENTATSDGGAISNLHTLQAVNSTFSGNGADRSGGAIHHAGISALLRNCTITLNEADRINNGFGEGGGIYVQTGKTVAIGNTILAGNFDTPANGGQGNVHPDISGAAVSAGHNLIGDRTGSTGLTDGVAGDIVGTGTQRLDAHLVALADNGGTTRTHLPQAQSPVLDAGDNALITDQYFGDTPTDQRGEGFERILDSNGDSDAVVDIGAVEFVPTTPVFDSTPVIEVDEDEPYEYLIVTSDVDAQEVMTITAPTLPFWLTLTPTGNGTATLTGTALNETIAPDYAGTTYDVVLRVTDTQLEVVEQSFTITVNGVNDAPEPEDDVAVVNEDTSIQIPVLVNDSDDDGNLPLENVAVATQPQHGTATVNPFTGVITYTPHLHYNGTDSFTYSVTDDGTPLPALTSTATVTVTVNAINDAPFTTPDGAVTNEDTPVTVNVLANDSDVDGNLDVSTLAIVTGPANGTAQVNTATGEITYTPNLHFNGTDSIVYSITDDGSPGPVATSTGTFTITVNPVNDVIVTVDDVATTDEDTPVVIDVLANDEDVDGAAVPGSVEVVSGPANGTTTVNPANGQITYTPNADFNGTDTFIYEVTDDGFPEPGLTADAIVTVTVNAVNDAPRLVPDTATTDEDTAVTVDVLANDADVDGNLLPETVTITAGPSHGTAQVDPVTGEITYTPSADYNGTDVLTYQVGDDGAPGPARQSSTTLTITVNAVNDAPRLVPDTATTDEDTPVTIDVLANDADVDGDLVVATLEVVDGPAHGSATVDNVTGIITYTPNANYNGADSFSYRVSDDGSPEPTRDSTTTVSITVNAVNDPPVPLDDVATGNEDTGISINVLDNDSDIDGLLDANSLTIVTPPQHGTVQVTPILGLVFYQPTADYNGPDSFTYSISDNGTPLPAQSATATVNVTVLPVNDAPRLVNDSVTMDEEGSVRIEALLNDVDVDGNIVPGTIRIGTPPSIGQAVAEPATGTILYTAAPDSNGVVTFTYLVDDDGSPAPGLSSEAQITVTINAVNDPPRTQPDSATTEEDTAVTVDVLANDTDVDGNLLPQFIAIVREAEHGTLTTNPADGSITYTPEQDFNGTDTFRYSIVDDGTPLPGLVSEEEVTITVTPVNDAPVIVDDFASTREDTAVTIDVLANDSDVEGPLDAATVTIVTAPQHGDAVVTETGEIVYTPHQDYEGGDSLVYSVHDSGFPLPALSGEATVAISVLGENDQIHAEDDFAQTNEDTAVVIDVLANDSDIETSPQPLSVQVVTQPAHGTTSVEPGTGKITYTPERDFFGVDTFVYIVGDLGVPLPVTFDVASVSVVVLPVNDAPVLNGPANVTAIQDELLFVSGITLADVDATAGEGDGTMEAAISVANGALRITPREGLTITGNNSTSVTIRGHITTVGAGLASLTYTGKPGYYGKDDVTVSVSDLGNYGSGGARTATRTIGLYVKPTDMVVSTLEDISDGNIAPGQVSLREAVTAMHDGGEITFAPGLSGTIELDRIAGPITITRDLRITGPGAGVITVSGGQESRAFTISDGSATKRKVHISGLSIVDGVVTAGVGGGAIWNAEELTLEACRISNSRGTDGGAVYNEGVLLVNNSTASGNTAFSRGGFLFNAAQGQATVRNSTLTDNLSNGNGGAVATLGAALLVNSTISNNLAVQNGGGIFQAGSASVRVINCTLYANVADTTGNSVGNGGGIFVVNGAAPLELANTIVGGNLDESPAGGVKHPDVSGVFVANRNNLLSSLNGGTGFGAKDLTLDPGKPMADVIAPTLANNGGATLTHALRLFSPAVNAGDNTVVTEGIFGALPADDQRGSGFPRIARDIVDIGAVELQPNSTEDLTVVIALQPNQDRLTAYMPLRFIITFSEEVQDFTVDDIVNAGTATNVTFTLTPMGSGVYELTATTSSNGTVIPQLVPNSVSDSWGTATDLTEPQEIRVTVDDTLDRDEDGVRDIDESQEDSDGDGLPDYLDSDADNDGVPDGIEVELGTDPTDTANPDSTLTLSQDAMDAGEEAGTAAIILTKYGLSEVAWSATVTQGSDWLFIAGDDTGVDSGTLRIAWAKNNTRETRVGVVLLNANASAFPRPIVVIQAACTLPQPPIDAYAQLDASNKRYRISWSSADPNPQTQYTVSLSADPAVDPIATVDGNLFDVAYNPPQGLFATCNGDWADPAKNTYYVRAINDCGMSEAVVVVSGDAKVAPIALPALLPGEEARVVAADAPVALRIDSASPIDEASLWFEAPVDADAEFVPLNEEGTSGWAIIAPATAWPAGVTFTVSAGDAANSVSAEFVVSEDAKSTGQTSLEDGITLLEGGVYEAPVTAWLPIPDGVDAETAVVLYYIADGATPGWYDAANVADLLSEGAYQLAECEGRTYIGITVNHGGAVRVASQDEAGALTAEASTVPGGDLVVAALLLLALAAGRVRFSRKQSVGIHE